MKQLLAIALSILTLHSYAQGVGEIRKIDDTDNSTFQFLAVAIRPIWPGCESLESESARFDCFNYSISKFIINNFKLPPAITKKEKKVQSGKVFVYFIIEKDGSISSAKILRSVHPKVDSEAIRMVQSIPDMYAPAFVDGKPVRMSYTLPINVQY
jgi:TonB family protein